MRPSVVMARALSSRGSTFCAADALVACDQFVLERVLLVGHRAGDDVRLAAFQLRPGQVEHLGRLHVGEGPEHLLQLGQVDELGEAAAGLAASRRRARSPSSRRPRRRWPPRRRNARCRGCRSPSGSRNRCIVYISTIVLRDRRAGGEGDAVAGVLLVQVAGLHVEVEGPLAAAGLDAGDAVHLGRRLQVLEVVRLVDEDVVDAQLVEDQPVVLLVLGQQVFQLAPRGGLLLLDGLDEVAVARDVPPAARRSAAGRTRRSARAGTSPGSPATCRSARSWVGHDDAVPVAGGDLGGQELAALLA